MTDRQPPPFTLTARIVVIAAGLFLITLSLAALAYAAWQETHTALAVGVVAEPSGSGTFRLLSTYCGEVIPGRAGNCWIRLTNLSSGTIHVDTYSVASRRTDVIIDETILWPDDNPVAYRGTAHIDVLFHATHDATPGPFVFDVSVMCSEMP